MLDYFFEENQIIELSLYHSESLDVSKDEKKQPPAKFLIGKLHFCLGDLVSSHQGVLTNNLLRGSGEVMNTAGTLISHSFCSQFVTALGLKVSSLRSSQDVRLSKDSTTASCCNLKLLASTKFIVGANHPLFLRYSDCKRILLGNRFTARR